MNEIIQNDIITNVELSEDNKGFGDIKEYSDWGSVKITRKRGLEERTVQVEKDYTALTNDTYIIGNPINGNIRVTIPPSNFGKKYCIKNVHASNSVTVDADVEIDGVIDIILGLQYTSITIIRGENEWSIISQIT